MGHGVVGARGIAVGVAIRVRVRVGVRVGVPVAVAVRIGVRVGVGVGVRVGAAGVVAAPSTEERARSDQRPATKPQEGGSGMSGSRARAAAAGQSLAGVAGRVSWQPTHPRTSPG